YLLYLRATAAPEPLQSRARLAPVTLTSAAPVPVRQPEQDRGESPEPAKPPVDEATKSASSDPKEAGALPLEDLVARVGPAVVAIETSSGRGSGFFVQKDTILTNAHVAGTDVTVKIRRASGDISSARVERVAA